MFKTNLATGRYIVAQTKLTNTTTTTLITTMHTNCASHTTVGFIWQLEKEEGEKKKKKKRNQPNAT